MRKLTLRITCGYKVMCDRNRGKKTSYSISLFLPYIFYFGPITQPFLCLLLITGAGNRSHRNGDVTELSNSQLKAVQFILAQLWCKWPSLEHNPAAVKPPVSDQPCTPTCHIDMAGYVNKSEEITNMHMHAHIKDVHISDHCLRGFWQGGKTSLLSRWLPAPWG